MDTNLSKLWKAVLTEMKPKVSDGNFGIILKPTFLYSLEDDIATIAAPSAIIINLLQKRFQDDIKRILDKQTGHDISVLFIQKSPLIDRKQGEEIGPLFSEQKTAVAPLAGHLPRVRPDFTFQSFAVSSSNQLAFVSAKTVAANIGKSYNPLFIYGPVGVGKTHLMHAIANEAYQKASEKKIIYITSEEFTNEVVEAIRNNETARMKKRFRSAYILLIDDVQFIEGKEKVQEELFHTFNILIDNGSQIALTSDRPPQEIKKLEKRLSSRFAGGLTIDIEKPDLELKTAIIQNKAKKYGREVKQTQLKGPKREASLVRARQVAMYVLQFELKLTLVEIGNLLGGRDHTTIMHGVEKTEKLVENKDRITEDIMGITKQLRG
jgi:chromosomal replication initiator protein